MSTLLFSTGLLGPSPWLVGALPEQNPMWVVAAAVIGILGTLVTTHRPNKNTEAKVALDGMKFLVDSLQAEVVRLSARTTILTARVVVLEAQLKTAGLTPETDLILP